MNRVSVLEKASNLITGDRADAYGDFHDQMASISGMYTSLTGKEIAPRDVALILMLLKLRRNQTDSGTDSLVDLCGYAALYVEAFRTGETK